jgi:threonyl-tRNA synthetase
MSIKLVRSDGIKEVSFTTGMTATDLATTFRIPLSKISCCKVNEKPCDGTVLLHDGDVVEFISFDQPCGKDVFWHTSAHVLAQAVLRLWPEAIPTIGPAIDEGFYYDFANLTISDQDFSKIEEEMKKIVRENFIPRRHVFKDTQEALQYFKNNPYKQELIQEFSTQAGEITGYFQGEFFDLCRGPHLPCLEGIGAIKVLKTSGAYWRGDSKRDMLTRIYAISFPSKKELQEYEHRIEEAKKRDHKILGPRLGLFSLHEEAPGFPFMHHKGMIIWNRLLEYWRQCHKRAGYEEIKTPMMMVRTLWERSGHWQNYLHNMFTSTIEEREFAIKPMNCPGAMLFYRSSAHSYRDLPWRVGEIGQVHRFEASGSLSGLFRVRSFHQDDAHIFMRPQDVQDEIHGVLRLIDEMYSTFGLQYTLVLSTRPKTNTIGTDADWELATSSLRQALENTGRPYRIDEGEGAFYGPKIDVLIFDALGRTWQCGTIQLDMSLPERFDLEYTAQDGSKQRPIMVHRVIYGAVERFMGALIEFYAGKFPLWLSPSQIAFVPVADRHVAYAKQLQQVCVDAGFETHVDESSESVSKKIRAAQLAQYNYILTVGDKEVEAQCVSVRTRDNVVHGEMQLDALLKIMSQERAEKRLTSMLT